MAEKRSRASKPDKNIRCEVLQELYTDEFKGRREKVAVVRWIVDEVPGVAKFERREFRVKDDGTESMGKAKGFIKKDCEYLVHHWDELSMFFN